MTDQCVSLLTTGNMFNHFLSIGILLVWWSSLGNTNDPVQIATVPSTNKAYYIDGYLLQNRTATQMASNYTTILDFREFLAYCHRYGLKGATIKTYEEQDAIEEFYNKTGYKGSFRLAGWDPEMKGEWIWLDDFTRIEAPGRFVNWDDGEPNQKAGENCITLFSNWYKWHDHPCKYSKGYRALCQGKIK